MGSSFSKNQFPVDGRTVLITGGSRGTGLEAGRQLAAKGASIIIVARDEAKLQESIASISRFHQISADLSDAGEAARVVANATAWNGGRPPDVVWCCAGSSHPTLFIDTPVDRFKREMDCNYFSSLYVAHAVLNSWLRPGETSATGEGGDAKSTSPASAATAATTATTAAVPRHLIFTASFLSFYTFTGWAAYSPCKTALRSLSDTLSQEMNLYAASRPGAPAVRLHTVFPAGIRTESYEAENRIKTDLGKKLEEGDDVQGPEEVARRAIHGLEAGRELVPTSFIVRLVMCASLGGSLRGGFFRGFVDTLLGWVVVVVMLFVRGDMDGKVKAWGRKYGSTGMKKAD